MYFLLQIGAEPRYGAFYGEGSNPIVVADLFCSGTERNLLSCRRNIFGITHCNDYEEAGVKCLGICITNFFLTVVWGGYIAELPNYSKLFHYL